MQGTSAGKGLLGWFREWQNYKTRRWYFCQVEAERASEAKRTEEKGGGKRRGKRNFSPPAKQDQGGGSDRQAAARNCSQELFPLPLQPEISRSGRFQHHSPWILSLPHLEGREKQSPSLLETLQEWVTLPSPWSAGSSRWQLTWEDKYK